MMVYITVFTATYNRAYRISNLYRSLCNQTFKNFEWLIVDDGSSDGTSELVQSWLSEGVLSIRYFYKDNGGKHRAINLGVQKALGEAFYIVDSDDVLPVDSLENISHYWSQVRNNVEFSGVCGLKCYYDGVPTGGFFPKEVNDWYSINKPYEGDMAEVFKTEIIRQYPFPDYPNERFCAESLVFNRIGAKYKLRYFNKNIYECEYLPDGLSASSIRNRRLSPTYATQIYMDLMRLPVSTRKKIKSAINFWRFFSFLPTQMRNIYKHIPIWACLFAPVGYALCVKDSIALRRNQNK